MALETLSEQPTEPVTDARSAIDNLLTRNATYLAGQDLQAQANERQSALKQYQDALKQPSAGTTRPEDVMLYTNIGNMGRMPALTALAQGVSAGGNFRMSQEQDRVKGDIEAAKAGYSDVLGRQQQYDRDVAALKGLLGKPSGVAGLSTEKLAQLSTSALVTARTEFDPKNTPNMTAEERSANIDRRAKEIFDNSVAALTGAGANMPSGAPQQAKTRPVSALPSVPDVAQSSPEDVTAESADAKLRSEGALKDNATTDRQLILKQNWDMEQKRIDMFGADSPQGQDALRNQALIKNEMRGLPMGAVQPPTPKVAAQASPTAKVVSTTPPASKTATEASYTSVLSDQEKESPFGMALNLPRVTTTQMSPMQAKMVKENRDEYLNGEEWKGIRAQAAGAKELRKFVDAAIESPAKTNSLSTLNNMLNSYANAAGIPLSEETKKQMREYTNLNQTEKAMGLVGQLMQRGVQTDKDFVRIVQAAFDTNLTPEQRRSVMRQYADNLNKAINKQRYGEAYMANPNSQGNERNWENKYNQMVEAGTPESVYMPNKKVLPYDEAARVFWNTDAGKPYKPSKDDSPEELQAKNAKTLKALNAYNARMREKLKSGAE